MSLPEYEYGEGGGAEIRPSFHIVPGADGTDIPDALQSEIFSSEEEQSAAPSTIALGSLALTPYNPAEKEIYDKPFDLTRGNFPGFYSHWYPFVRAIAFSRMSRRERGVEAHEDVAQRVFEAIITDYMETGKYLGLKEGSSPRGLLSVLTRNKGVDHFRRELRNEKLERVASSHFPLETPSAEEVALENLERQAEINLVRRSFSMLNPDEQKLIWRTNDGAVINKLAEEMGITPGALRVRSFRARQKLKGLIEDTINGRITRHQGEQVKTAQEEIASPASVPKPRVPASKKHASTPRVRKPVAPKKPSADNKTAKELVAVPDVVPVQRNLPTPDINYVREASVGHYESRFAAAGLSTDEVDILAWSDVDGSSAADLGNLFGKSKGAVDIQIQHLRRRVRTFMESS